MAKRSGLVHRDLHVAGWLIFASGEGKSTRSTQTHTLDAIFYPLITGATFGWLWPR